VLLEHGQTISGSPQLSDRERAIQRVQSGRRDPLQERVAIDDPVPARLRKRRGEAVLGRDASLGVVARKTIALRRLGEPRQPELNLRLIPERAVLLFE
jgi:hypothetical protein